MTYNITIFLRLGPYNRFIIKVVIHFEFQGDRFFVMDNEFSNLASLMSLPWWSFCVLSNSEIRSFWSEMNQNIHCYCIWYYGELRIIVPLKIVAKSAFKSHRHLSYFIHDHHARAYNFQWHDYSQFSIISPYNHTDLFSHKRTPNVFELARFI